LLPDFEVFNHGVDGDETHEILNRISDVLECHPSICFIMGGVNDIACSFVVPAILKNLEPIGLKLTENWIRPIFQNTLMLLCYTPGDNWSSSRSIANARG
jgi:lysophospholipase L1-like esterase